MHDGTLSAPRALKSMRCFYGIRDGSVVALPALPGNRRVGNLYTLFAHFDANDEAKQPPLGPNDKIDVGNQRQCEDRRLVNVARVNHSNVSHNLR